MPVTKDKESLDGTYSITVAFTKEFKFALCDSETIFAVVLPFVRIYLCPFDPALFVISQAMLQRKERIKP